jgi:hypothetical protein
MLSSNIPSLATIHSGVPERLQQDAVRAKSNTWSLKTLPDSRPRESSLRLPPGITRDVFDTAIKSLREVLGEPGVELNDKDLIDGWYMQHP